MDSVKMKAQLLPRIELTGRTRLEEVIPLSTPFTVFVDPASTCNFKCTFCPTGDTELIRKTGRFQGLLDFDLYRKVVDELGLFEKKIKVLRLYKEGEPLLHPRFVEMVDYARKSGHCERIDTTTNAALLTPELNRRLVDAGLDRINISIEGMSKQTYKEFAHANVDFQRLVDMIADFYENRKQCEVVIKTVRENLKEGEEEAFFSTFGNIADRIFIENMAPCWPQFDYSKLNADFSVGIYGQKVGYTDVCPYIFYSLSVNSDGSVSLCFLDWERKLIIGDVTTHTLKQVWDGLPMLNYRIMMLSRRRSTHPVCGSCGQLTNCLPDNIDPFAEQLLQRLQQVNHV